MRIVSIYFYKFRFKKKLNSVLFKASPSYITHTHIKKMFTIQIFCSYSINYKSFSLSATKTMCTFFELYNRKKRQENKNKKEAQKIQHILSQFIWWLPTVLLGFYLLSVNMCVRTVVHANLGVHFCTIINHN